MISQALPISLDLQISVSKIASVTALDLSVTVFVTDTGPLPPGNGRIRYYDSKAAVDADFGTSSQAALAATAFFSQNPRSATLAIAQAFTVPQAAFLTTSTVGALSNFTPILDGSFNIAINGDAQDITGLDFSADLSLDDVATTVQTALQAIATGGYVGATAEIITSGSVSQMVITSGVPGDGSTITVLSAAASGTDVSGAGLLNGQTGAVVNGYTPTGFTNELDLIAQAASNSGRFVYAWTLDATYRDSQESLDAAAWAEAQDLAVLGLVSNDPLSYDSNSTLDIPSQLFVLQYERTFISYNQPVEAYPELSWLALIQSVDYAGSDTTITAKFKVLPGIATTPLTETQYDVLKAKRCNAYTLMDNGATVTREGDMVNNSWFIDDRTNTDNFISELQTNVYNVFLGNKKVPYTSAGVTLLRNAEAAVCERYITNGALAPIQNINPAVPNGLTTTPAYAITFQPLESVLPADREARRYTGNQIDLHYAGAIHFLSIDVTITE